MELRWTAIFLLLLLQGCSNIIRPPMHLQAPVTVYLTDEGMHSSVLMPLEDGRFVEYALGDWDYAALNKHGFFQAIRALLFCKQGALGRRYLKLDPASNPMSRELKEVKVYPLAVDCDKLQSTEAVLARRFDAGKTPAENPDNHFVFVKVDGGYGFFNNCNTLTKQTLRQLNCRVIDRSAFAMYEIQK